MHGWSKWAALAGAALACTVAGILAGMHMRGAASRQLVRVLAKGSARERAGVLEKLCRSREPAAKRSPCGRLGREALEATWTHVWDKSPYVAAKALELLYLERTGMRLDEEKAARLAGIASEGVPSTREGRRTELERRLAAALLAQYEPLRAVDAAAQAWPFMRSKWSRPFMIEAIAIWTKRKGKTTELEKARAELLRTFGSAEKAPTAVRRRIEVLDGVLRRIRTGTPPPRAMLPERLRKLLEAPAP